MILGNPFPFLIELFTIDDEEINTNLKGENITFKLVFPKRTLISSPKKDTVRKSPHINFLKEVQIINIQKNLDFVENQQKIKSFQKKFEEELCNNLLIAFWKRKKHKVSLPSEKSFHESQTRTKARPIQMNKELGAYCQHEIQDLHTKNLIRPI